MTAFPTRQAAGEDGERHHRTVHDDDPPELSTLEDATGQLPGPPDPPPYWAGCGVCGRAVAGPLQNFDEALDEAELHRRRLHGGIRSVSLAVLTRPDAGPQLRRLQLEQNPGYEEGLRAQVASSRQRFQAVRAHPFKRLARYYDSRGFYEDVAGGLVQNASVNRWQTRRTSGAVDPTLGDAYLEGAVRAIRQAHVFEVEPEVVQLLLLTKNRHHPLRLPFPCCFLDADITIGTLRARGVLVCQSLRDPTRQFAIVYANQLDPATGQDVHDLWFTTDLQYALEEATIDPGLPDAGNFLKLQKSLALFVLNWIDLLQTPDVELVRRDYSDGKAKKLERSYGSPPPATTQIMLTGETKRYVDSLRAQRHARPAYRFWVRGHWRTLRDTEYWKERTGQRIWILPYVKGQGILVQKTYHVRRAADDSTESSEAPVEDSPVESGDGNDRGPAQGS